MTGAHSRNWPGPASCEHSSVVREGRLLCRWCGAEYRITIGGARWTGPRPLIVATYFPDAIKVAAE
jgi:hypothetical protein